MTTKVQTETKLITDNAARKQQVGRPFKPGQSGNPAGRPKGSRNRHSENFLNAFARDFERHGAAVIETVRKERPQDYLKVAASLLPKQMETETRQSRPFSELSDAELIGIILDETEVIVEAVLVSRGHAPLTVLERQQLQDREQGGGDS